MMKILSTSFLGYDKKCSSTNYKIATLIRLPILPEIYERVKAEVDLKILPIALLASKSKQTTIKYLESK